MRTPAFIALCLVVGSCASGGDGGDRSTDTLGVAPVRAVGATAAPPSAPPAAGTWDLERLGAAPDPGIRMTLVIDSVVDGAAFGRVTRYLAGNAGGEPDPFGPILGTVAGNGLTLTSERNGLSLAGTLARDTVRLTRLALGGSELDGEWLLVRE